MLNPPSGLAMAFHATACWAWGALPQRAAHVRRWEESLLRDRELLVLILP